MTASFDLTDPAFVADPYPALAEARRQGPVLRHEGLGLWVTTTHAAANDVLRDRRLGRILRPRSPGDDAWTTFDWLHADSILDSEPPKHTRLRRLVAGAFARGHVTRLRPRVEEIAAGLLDEVERVLARDGRVDVIAGYAEPLPVLVICELLGAPTADWKVLRDWSQAIVRMYEVDPDDEAQRDAQRACDEFASYVEALAAERAQAPGDDLLTSLVQERDGGDRLSPRELVATVVLLLNAGHEASVNGFGNGLASLLVDTAQRDAVNAGLDHPVVVDRLVEEMLRHDSPLHLFERTATADVELHGVTVRAGEKVAALLGAANRDPAVFAEADRFVADRDPNPHLAFGAGIHFCLGAPLARMELQISTRALLERLGSLEVVEAVRRPTFVLRGYERLVVARAGRST
ncbi:cytochrome P450 [Terrabacter sp. Root181]|uniref:cytochrome P450 n=1 Tax=Terrabacter sp. Root181 TaxID=1736484 RepID=UPI0007013E6F|nr:cytochrome P450 [Terrabacter sp. Root181]KRB43755.1 cytochrome [Terrabacter sp. Root181]